jgi:hypothetical protein
MLGVFVLMLYMCELVLQSFISVVCFLVFMRVFDMLVIILIMPVLGFELVNLSYCKFIYNPTWINE